MANKLVTFWERAKVIARSLPGRVVAIATIVAAAAPQLAGAIPADKADGPLAVAIQAATFVVSAVVIVRNVTQVPAAERGILPSTPVYGVVPEPESAVTVLGGPEAQTNDYRPPDIA